MTVQPPLKIYDKTCLQRDVDVLEEILKNIDAIVKFQFETLRDEVTGPINYWKLRTHIRQRAYSDEARQTDQERLQAIHQNIAASTYNQGLAKPLQNITRLHGKFDRHIQDDRAEKHEKIQPEAITISDQLKKVIEAIRQLLAIE